MQIKFYCRDILDFNGKEDSRRGLLGRDAV